jgi:hypothetical protein
VKTPHALAHGRLFEALANLNPKGEA